MSRRFPVAAAAALAAAACASPGTPPGGPERLSPPRLVRVSPDTNAVEARPREVVFTYDAVVSEAPRGGSAGGTGTGATGLETVTLVSPRSGSVSVDWRRERVAVRPRQGFRPNVTYTVTLGPGIQDLRNNVQDTAAVAVFSTGGPVATQVVRGVVFDWVNGRPAQRAVVEATGADSVTYVALSDSAGRFVVPNVPAGRYLVRGTIDLNTNRAADPREAFDTARAAAEPRRAPLPIAVPPAPNAPPAAPPVSPPAGPAPADTSEGVAIYAFPRDTLPARLQAVTVVDSVTLRLTFDRPLRPGQAYAPRIRVLGPDSAAVAVTSALSTVDADSVARVEAQRAAAASDTGAARRDTAGAPPAAEPARAGGVQGAPLDSAREARARAARRNSGPPPTPPPALRRPVPPTELVVRLGAPLRPVTNYRVRVTDLRSLNSVAGTSDRVITTPRPTPPPASPAPANAPAVTPRTGAPAAPGARPPASPVSRP